MCVLLYCAQCFCRNYATGTSHKQYLHSKSIKFKWIFYGNIPIYNVFIFYILKITIMFILLSRPIFRNEMPELLQQVKAFFFFF